MSAAEIISIYAIAAIWFMMMLNVILSIGGYFYIYRCNQTDGHIPVPNGEYPMVSVLVPAHNEALVVQRTVRSLLNFDYPKEKYEIIVINDNSSDDTESILSNMAAEFPANRLICISTDKVVGGTGKSNALNIGFSVAAGSMIAIYDADNTPEPQALRLLVENLVADPKAGAVIGKALENGFTAAQRALFHRHVAQLMRYYLIPAEGAGEADYERGAARMEEVITACINGEKTAPEGEPAI